MTKAPPVKETLQVPGKAGVSEARLFADVALDPLIGAAFITTTFTKDVFGPTDLTATAEAMRDRGKAVRGNDLASVEDMLTGQAASLNALFLELVRRSGANMGEYIQAAETYMRLALKAQAQCRATLETLANIKNPPVVYARQANIAAGPQQVNNATSTRRRAPARAENSASPPNELLETEHGNRLEPGTAGAASGGDPALEALGAIDGPQTAAGKANASRNADKGGKRLALRAELTHLRELMRELDAEQREGW